MVRRQCCNDASDMLTHRVKSVGTCQCARHAPHCSSTGRSPVQTSPKPVAGNVSPAVDSAAPPRSVEEDARASALRSLARAVWIVAACAAVAALRVGRDLLIPLVLGVLAE